MNNKIQALRNLKRSLEYDAISIRKYLSLYYGLNIEPYDFNISHSDIKVLLPYIKRVGFEQFDSRDLELVPVIDSFGNVAIYRKPILKEEIDTIQTIVIEQDSACFDTSISFDELKPYELAELCRTYRSTGRIKEYRLAYKVLKGKKKKDKNKTKIYKRDNRNLKNRGEDYDEF